MKVNSMKPAIAQHRIMFYGSEYIIVIRKDTLNFLKILKSYFNLYIMTFMSRELVFEILKIIDPDKTIFKNRD